MFRLLVLGLAIWLTFIIVRHLAKSKPPSRPTKKALPETNTVRCAHCDLHFPEREAVRDGDKVYCSESHRRASKSRSRR